MVLLSNVPDLSKITIQEDVQKEDKLSLSWIDSRVLARVISYTHRNLMEKIRDLESRFEGTNYMFRKSTFLNTQNHTCPCYRISKEGCQLIGKTLMDSKKDYLNKVYPALFDKDSKLGKYLRMDEENRTKAYEKLLHENTKLIERI